MWFSYHLFAKITNTSTEHIRGLKYDRGLNREIVSAVNIGKISEPFGIAEIKRFAFSKGWIIADTYINVTLERKFGGSFQDQRNRWQPA